MKTLRVAIDPKGLTELGTHAGLGEAAAILRAGGTVALPTETVYGLGANALSISAVAKVFEAKGRPGWDPLIVHVADEEMLMMVVGDVPEAARLLMKAFWPGPLTLLLPRSAVVPDAVTAGRPLVGVRIPAHPVALELIRRAGVPVAAPSANRFGHTSPTTAQHVLDDLDGLIDAVVDAGATALGIESTVLDPCQSPMVVYRPGAITLEQIEAVAGPVKSYVEHQKLVPEPREALPAPGVGLRHYAPRARLILVEATWNQLEEELLTLLKVYSPMKAGVMLPDGTHKENFTGIAHVYSWGRWPAAGEEPEELAQRLFAGLRQLDSLGCDVIVCPLPTEHGIGRAIRDRLRKASFPPEMLS